MRVFNLFLLSLVVVLFLGCKNEKDPYSNLASAANAQSFSHPGKELLETNCYACHSPSADHDNRLAPPMAAVKMHYINTSTTKEEFTEEMQDWIKNPTESKAKMRGAVRRFGLMPKAFYSEETIEKIADYIYDHEIEQPAWFESHRNEKQGMQKGQNRHGQAKGQHRGSPE